MTTTVQIRIDEKMKREATKTLKAMGLDMSTGVKLFLAQVVNTKSIPFPVMSMEMLPRERKLELVREAKEALKGKGYRTARELHDAIK